MNIQEFMEYCLSKKGVVETTPFGPDVLVMKVMGKMFALCGISNYDGFSLKCDPSRSLELREEYPGKIQGAYHLNKTHWNEIKTDGSVPESLLKELIDHSYALVVQSLSKKDRTTLNQMN